MSGCYVCLLSLLWWWGYCGLVGCGVLWRANIFLSIVSGVFGYTEYCSSSGGVAMLLSGVFQGASCLCLLGCRCVLSWPSALLDCPWYFGSRYCVAWLVALSGQWSFLFQLFLPSLLNWEGEVA